MIKTHLTRHLKARSRGAALTEYGILAGLVAVISIGAVSASGERISGIFSEAADAFDEDKSAEEQEVVVVEPAFTVDPAGGIAFSFVVEQDPRVGNVVGMRRMGTQHFGQGVMLQGGASDLYSIEHTAGDTFSDQKRFYIYSRLSDYRQSGSYVECNGVRKSVFGGTGTDSGRGGAFNYYMMVNFNLGDEVSCQMFPG